MTDRFNTISFRQLFKIIQKQLQQGQFFDIPDNLFFWPSTQDPFRLNYLGQTLETPIGVAAGPHTQLAQNIVAAWLCGARFIELKTVQTLDELNVSKPCIDMQNEGYNCEWSQELKIQESFEQYLNAWILIHILKHQLGHDNLDRSGTIFNMSVGYDLKGILQENVQWFFAMMKDCSADKKQKLDEIRDLFPDVDKINIPDCISDNITLSTMHGCPPEEIEQISLYLLKEKKLHTNIKLNPTLLGKNILQEILKKSGFKTQVPDIAFEHDLKYADALKIIRNLEEEAKRQKLHFGLKLTNTLESKNHKSVFPEHEKMMYMSGNALHAISINLAARLQNDFNGELSLSFSGGANAENISSVLAGGLYPVTVCTDILKPGGYSLLGQYLNNISNETSQYKANSIDELATNKAKIPDFKKARLANLVQYADEVLTNPNYHRKGWLDPTIKTARKLDSFDCIQAPCVDTCPTHQDIPDYLYYTAQGDFDQAFEVIMRTNPFPNSTGMVCDHLCQTRCTRINYDDPLLIREIKRFVAEEAPKSKHWPILKNKFLNKKTAIIGAGPSGLSAAYFLALAGMDVDIFEIKNKPGGMVAGAIPEFRLTDEAFEKDISRIKSLGVKIHYNHDISKEDFDKIRVTYDYVYIAVGAPVSKPFIVPGIEANGVLDPLKFLFEVKKGEKTGLGKNVIIAGGGNTAMDAARTAFRLVGKNGKVQILYRRSIENMPADQGEIKAVIEEGVEIMEMVLPIKVNAINDRINSVSCVRMNLVPSNNGRPQPIVIPGSEFELEADTLIPAIGQDLDIDFLDHQLLESKAGVYETKIPGVFIGGDALRGASTAINAIADGRKVSRLILLKTGAHPDFLKLKPREKTDIRTIMAKRANKAHGVPVNEIPLTERKSFQLVTSTHKEEEVMLEASRCLQCDEVCNTCVTVCPNLALYSYLVNPIRFELQKIEKIKGKTKLIFDELFEVRQAPQILHIADWCNECGNCTTFCPTADAPYKVKPHIYLNKEAFGNNDDCYFYDDELKTLFYKKDNGLHQLSDKNEDYLYLLNDSEVIIEKNTFKVKSFKLKENQTLILNKAAEMSFILVGAKEILGER